MARDFDAEIADINAVVSGLTAPKAFLQTVGRAGSHVAIRSMRGDAPGSWHEWTWAEYRDEVAALTAGLAAQGLAPGDRVILMMRNRPEFHFIDTAAQFLRLTPFSIYNSSAPEEIAYQASHSEATVAVLEDATFLERFLKVRDELPHLREIFVINPPDGGLPDGVRAYDRLKSYGVADLEPLADATEPSDLATLIYTSGTTGPPKGVMLSQYNVMYTSEQLTRCYDYALGDEGGLGIRYVSYLPMAHIAERMSSHYQGLSLGLSVTCCPDPGSIATYAKEVHPEVMFGVPRVWEKVYNGVNAALAGNPEQKAKFDEAVAVAKAIVDKRRAGTATAEDDETYAFLDAVAFANVRGLVGLDHLRLAITGAAPIPREVIDWYNAIGIPLTEIYGMSESSGPMTWEAQPMRIKPGTVGPAIPGCEVTLADDGEIICRGGNVFQGYFKQPDKTAEALIDGWLHSGDIGVIDDDGFVRIVDRKKELIITAGGKNISPANLEAALKTIPLVAQACSIGDNRKFVSALLVLDPEYAPIWAKANGIEGSLSDIAADQRAVDAVASAVSEINRQFAQVEQIKKFTLLGEEWLPDSDVLTPTSKLKRRGVLARYHDEIEAMYAE